MSTSASDGAVVAAVAIAGDYYDGVSSRREDARLLVASGGLATLVVGARAPVAAPLSALAVSARVGDIPCAIRFADGGTFHTADNDAIDRLLAAGGQRRAGSRLHALESRWSVVAALLAVLVAEVLWLLTLGLPLLAEKIAFAMSPETAQYISQGVLATLDQTMFAPTTLAAEQQDRLRGVFEDVVKHAAAAERFTLHFRASPTVGANAFALPSGDIVLTDELVALAERDDEIAAVLAHEVGHVVHRHALRRLVQGSGVAMIVLAVGGDAGSVASFAAALPTLLVEMTYSREFEREADRDALAYLQARGHPLASFTDLLGRLEASHGGDGDRIPGFLSTHPSTDERRAMFAGS